MRLEYFKLGDDEFYLPFSLLKEGGKVITDVCEFPRSPLAAVVMDKYGVRWYITLPQHRPAEEESLL